MQAILACMHGLEASFVRSRDIRILDLRELNIIIIIMKIVLNTPWILEILFLVALAFQLSLALGYAFGNFGSPHPIPVEDITSSF